MAGRANSPWVGAGPETRVCGFPSLCVHSAQYQTGILAAGAERVG
jgi:hypothetical protein